MNFIKQTFNSLRQYPVMTWVTVIGTALSIFLIMVVVMLQQVKVAPFAPESNRDRFLHSTYASIKNESEEGESNGPQSHQYVQKQFKSLKTPEAVTAYSVMSFGNIGEKNGISAKVDVKYTDADFWKVFDFGFLEGKPYDTPSFDAGLSEIVLSESVARKILGSTDVVGREVFLDFAPYKVVGVVKDVSTLASKAYAQVWIPYTAIGLQDQEWGDIYVMGQFCVTILAKSPKDLDAIREEYSRRLEDINEELAPTNWKVIPRNRPYTQEKESYSYSSNNEPDLATAQRSNYTVYLILLLVPAINLSSMTESRLKQRTAEIGVRRAFGSTRGEIIFRIICENLVITLAAGILGWLMSVVFAYFCSSYLFSQPFSATFNPPTVDMGMLIQWPTFFMALLFCFVLNLLSSGLPAWKASRSSIVNALSGHTR